MSERDTDLELRRAFQSFATATLPHVRPPGAEQAHATAGRRRRNRVLATSLAVVLLLIPATVFALTHFHGDAPPLPITPPTGLPSPTSSPSGAPTGTPTGSPSGTGAPSASAPVPPPTAALGPGELANATLALNWSWAPANDRCANGPATFKAGSTVETPTKPQQLIIKVTHVDVNNDGTPEVIALVMCRTGETGPEQVVAVRSTGSNTFSTLAMVTHTDDSRDLAIISDMAGTSAGLVRVQVADRMSCCGTPPAWPLRQWRTYKLAGNSFTQSSGPVTFRADPSVADLTATEASVHVGGIVDGGATGTLVLTLHNRGPQAARQVRVVLTATPERVAGGSWGHCDSPDYPEIEGVTCDFGDIGAGKTVTLSLPVLLPGPPVAKGANMGRARLRAGEYSYDDLEILAS